MGDHGKPAWRKAANHLLPVAMLMKGDLDAMLTSEIGHTLADNEALAHLRDAGGPLKMGEIAERLTLTPGGATKLVDRLERSGYVARGSDPTDRRTTTVTITPDGLSVLDRARPLIVAMLYEQWGRHLSTEEAETVLRVLKRVYEANWCG